MMVPQSFVIGALLCWISTVGVLYVYHLEIVASLLNIYRRDWSEFHNIPDDTWLASGIIVFTAVLPLVLLYIRPQTTTEVTLYFARPSAAPPVVIIKNLGRIGAERAKYTAVLMNLDDPHTPENTPMANAECAYLKPSHGCGPLTITYNTNLSYPKNTKILGLAEVDCNNCDKVRGFWLYINWQNDGWYSEIDDYHGMNLKSLMENLPMIKLNIGNFLGTISGPRVPFAEE